MNECDHYRQLEEAAYDGIPEGIIDEKLDEWDENTHLGDYPGELEIDLHYSEEYNSLRSIGLTNPQAEKVINHG